MSFFDIVLDFILMDAFEDLENPPSSVLAVLRNRWLSDSFKETVGAHPFPMCVCPVTFGTVLSVSSYVFPEFTYQSLPTEMWAVSRHSGTPCCPVPAVCTFPSVLSSQEAEPPLWVGTKYFHFHASH